MHPDQHTPDSHRYQAPDSRTPNPDAAEDAPSARVPELSQQAEEHLETTSQTVQTPQPEGARIAEAGNQYVGRQMADDMKANPRVDDGEDATQDEDPA